MRKYIKLQSLDFRTAFEDNMPDVLYSSPIVRETKKDGIKITNKRNSSIEFDDWYENRLYNYLNEWEDYEFLLSIETNRYNDSYYTRRIFKSKDTVYSPYWNRVHFKDNESTKLFYSQKERI